ncbi:MAG: 4'-phosphopantetheinyl transferase family protein [Chloroflexota bacterium]
MSPIVSVTAGVEASTPAARSLPVTSVHVWQVPLLQPAGDVDALMATLSPDEAERARRFHFARDRRRFVVARGTLRRILAAYLGMPPEGVVFSYGARGKPFLAATHNPSDLRFNLAHAHEMALFAFACRRETGVDIEHIHPLPDAAAIAGRFFAAREYRAWLHLPEAQRLEGFFHCWTRKEAYIKAIGDGLSKPLDQFEVSLEAGETSCLLHVAGDPQEVERWTLLPFPLAVEGYVAALAVEQRAPVQIETFTQIPA